MSYTCGTWTALRPDPDSETWIAVRVLCHRWSCETCAKKLQRHLISNGTNGHPNTMITLTAAPEASTSPDEHARRLSIAWSNLVKVIRRRYGPTALEYLLVFEATAAGAPHVHILARCCWLPKRWLASEWCKRTGAYIIDIRRIHNPQMAAAYCAKYLGKAPHKFARTKRFRLSKGFLAIAEETLQQSTTETLHWGILRVDLTDLTQHWQDQGYPVTQPTPNLAILHKHPNSAMNLLDPDKNNSPGWWWVQDTDRSPPSNGAQP